MPLTCRRSAARADRASRSAAGGRWSRRTRAPASRSASPASPSSSVGNGPLPTRVAYAFVMPTTVGSPSGRCPRPDMRRPTTVARRWSRTDRCRESRSSSEPCVALEEHALAVARREPHARAGIADRRRELAAVAPVAIDHACARPRACRRAHRSPAASLVGWPPACARTSRARADRDMRRPRRAALSSYAGRCRAGWCRARRARRFAQLVDRACGGAARGTRAPRSGSARGRAGRARSSACDLLEQHGRIDHHALAEHALLVGVERARRARGAARSAPRRRPACGRRWRRRA